MSSRLLQRLFRPLAPRLAWSLAMPLATPLAMGWLALACGNKSEAKAPDGTTAVAPSTTVPADPPCVDGPLNPGEVIAKEPNVFSACLGAAKPDPALCGNAKIALTIGKDGRVSSAQVAQSSLPPEMTECMKARLAAIRYACPKEGSASYTVPVGLPAGCPGLPSPAATAG